MAVEPPTFFDGSPTHKVTVVYRSRDDPRRAWSGIPWGLRHGLVARGVEPTLVNAEPPSVLVRASKAWAAYVRRDRHGGLHAPELRELRRATALIRGRRLAHDAAIQMGSDFGNPFSCRFASFEDMTVAQLARVAPAEAALLGSRAVQRWREAQARCYEAAYACCVASSWAAESVVHDYGVDPAKVHVVGFGRNYDPLPTERDWSRPRFLFMGYEWERKNGPLVVRAFDRLRESYPAARLDLVGRCPPIDRPGITTHGVLDFSEPAERRQVESLLETATCFLMPSQYEPFGMVYVEAAAAGVASIGTAVGGARDIIGATAGFVVDPFSEEDVLEAMATMCDPDQAMAMGAEAQARSRHFTWDAVARRVLEALGLGADEGPRDAQTAPAPTVG